MLGGGTPGDPRQIDPRPSRQVHLLRRRERRKRSTCSRPTMSSPGALPPRSDRLRDRCRAAAQRHQPRRRRPRGHPRHDLLGDEHDRQQQRGVERPLRGDHRPGARAHPFAAKGWTRHDIRSYLHLHSGNLFGKLAFDHRYGKIYNRNLPRWYKRDLDARIPIVPSPDHIQFVCHRRHRRPVLSAWSSPAGGICRRRCCAASRAAARRVRSASTGRAICRRASLRKDARIAARRGMLYRMGEACHQSGCRSRFATGACNDTTAKGEVNRAWTNCSRF